MTKQFKIAAIVDEEYKDKVINVLLDIPHLIRIPKQEYKVYVQEVEVVEG